MKIGWIGIGNMGKPMAKNLQKFASEFTVNDLNQESAIDILEDGDDVQNVSANFDISDEVMAQLSE